MVNNPLENLLSRLFQPSIKTQETKNYKANCKQINHKLGKGQKSSIHSSNSQQPNFQSSLLREEGVCLFLPGYQQLKKSLVSTI